MQPMQPFRQLGQKPFMSVLHPSSFQSVENGKPRGMLMSSHSHAPQPFVTQSLLISVLWSPRFIIITPRHLGRSPTISRQNRSKVSIPMCKARVTGPRDPLSPHPQGIPLSALNCLGLRLERKEISSSNPTCTSLSASRHCILSIPLVPGAYPPGMAVGAPYYAPAPGGQMPHAEQGTVKNNVLHPMSGSAGLDRGSNSQSPAMQPDASRNRAGSHQ